MKKIKKLRLINWHFFDDAEFNFSEINVITGENGTGKSTILDAIHYLQSGGACQFNFAANNLSSGRSVINYLKARVGGEKREFVRDCSDIIGHIAIEYDNTTTHSPFVLGCVLQLSNGELISPVFYKIDGETYRDELFFTDEKEVKNIDEMEKSAKALGLPFAVLGQKRQSEKARKKAVIEALGVSDKYEILFAKAIGFEPLEDISKFATGFLLPEYKLDLSSIKNSMDEYRDIQMTVAMEEKRAEELKPIVANQERYEEGLKKEIAYDILLKQAEIDICTEEIENNLRKIHINKSRAEELAAACEKERERENEERNSAQAIRSSDAFRQIKELCEREESLSADLKKMNSQIDNWMSRVEHESRVAASVGTSLDLRGIILKKDYEAYLSTLHKYSRRLETISSQNDDKWIETNSQKKEKNLKKDRLGEEIKKLESNLQAYDPHVEALAKAIVDKVRDRHNVVLDAPTCLCAFLEINDSEWRDAIEGLLDNRRFDYFVKANYFQTAKEAFDANPAYQDYFGVGVVQQSGEEFVANPGSLAEKIDAFRIDPQGNRKELREPRNYINHLLGDVYCVESPDEFKDGTKAITKAGVYFDGHSIRYVSAAAISKPFIGQEAKVRRLKAAQGEFETIEGDLREIEKQIDELKNIASAIKSSRCEDLLSTENLWARADDIAEHLKKTRESREELESANGDLIKMELAARSHEKAAIEHRERINQLGKERDSANETAVRLTAANEENEKKISECRSVISQKFDDFPDKSTRPEDYVALLKKNLCGKALKEHAFQMKGASVASKESARRIIANAIAQYCANHPGELGNDISNYKEYVARYNKIMSDDLAKLKPDLDDAYYRSVSELREHFISRIRRSLEAAQKTIDDLNRTLRKHPFGVEEETFEFITSRSRDSLLGGVYHIAVETNQDTVTDNLFVESLDAESQAIMQKVFDVLSKPEDDADTRELRREITDYRSYLHYDIRIKVKDGNNRLFSQNFNAKSGGETQTPFYALIAGAFQSLIADKEKNGFSPTGLVLFDEAFNNMDGGRIKQMLQFYKELNVQLIISVPSSRLSYILPYASSVTSLVKDDYAVAVYQTRSKQNAR